MQIDPSVFVDEEDGAVDGVIFFESGELQLEDFVSINEIQTV